MNASELRIGNFVGAGLIEFPENYFTVFEVANSNMVVQDGLTPHGFRDLIYFDAELLEPIPLTEEWFFKFCFTKSNDPWGGWLSPSRNGNQIRIVDGYWDAMFSKAPCNYVHQLQNLYFALTGDELYLR